MSDVVLLAFDPVEHKYFTPALLDRLSEFANEHFNEGEPELHVRQVLARLSLKDPGICLLFAVTPKGEVVGHCLATLEGHGNKRWVYGWQCLVNGKQDGLVDEIIKHLEGWGSASGATNIIMTTHRNAKAWEKAYKFASKHTVMTRPIPYTEEVIESEQG